MAKLIKSMILLAACLAPPTDAADSRLDLAQVPVADMKAVPSAEFAKAAAVAERGGTPVEIALAIAGPFEGSTQHIIQVNEGAEAPSASRVTVLRDGLLDDSVRGDRWDIVLEKTPAGAWKIKEVKRAWRCRRGDPVERFATTPCR
jgi:hypothetical protein